MIGKKNIVFGFLFFIFTAALGPYMVQNMMPDTGASAAAKQAVFSELQLIAENGFEKDLEPLSATALAQINTNALLALNTQMNQAAAVEAVKSGPHAHGNLEAMLNIVVGLSLSFIAGSLVLKQIISWLFILGTLLHSGVLYMLIMFKIPLAGTLLSTGIGPIMIIAGLLLAGIAAVKGLRSMPVQDDFY